MNISNKDIAVFCNMLEEIKSSEPEDEVLVSIEIMKSVIAKIIPKARLEKLKQNKVAF